MKITCGVPQGSILGPLLFILYINDIVKVSTVLNPVLLADDTSRFHAHTDFDTLIEEINEELQKVTTWFHTNKLSLSIKKFNFIIFLPKGKKSINQSIFFFIPHKLLQSSTTYSRHQGSNVERGKLKCNTYKTLSPIINYSYVVVVQRPKPNK